MIVLISHLECPKESNMQEMLRILVYVEKPEPGDVVRLDFNGDPDGIIK